MGFATHSIDADIRDLRKGVGWVRGRHGVDGEYVE